MAPSQTPAAPRQTLQFERRPLLRKLVACRGMKEIRPHLRQEAVLYADDYDLEHPEEAGSILDLAIYFHRLDLAEKFLTFAGRASAERLVQLSKRAVVWAARDGREAFLTKLLSLKGDISRKDWHGRSPLHASVLRGHTETTKVLLQHRAWDVETDKEVVEHWVHHWKLVPEFDAAGVHLDRAPPQRGASRSTTPLLESKDDVPNVEATPARVGVNKAQLAKMTKDLQEQLMKAIEDENLVEIESLVRRGAPLQPKYSSHRLEARFTEDDAVDLVNPVDWATVTSKFRAAEKLLEIGDGTLTFGRDQVGSYLVRNNLAAQTKRALPAAAFRNEWRLLRQLLQRKADVSQKSPHGESSLMLAIRQGHDKAVEILLQHGAWESEDMKTEVMLQARSQGMSSVLAAAGVLAEGNVEAEPVPPRAVLIQKLTSGADRDKPFVVDRLMEQVSRPTSAPSSMQASPRARRGLPPSPVAAAVQSRPSSAKNVSSQRVSDTPLEIALTKTEYLREHAALTSDLKFAIRKGDLAKIQALVAHGASLKSRFDLRQGLEGNSVDLACVSAQPAAALLLLKLAEERNQDLVKEASAAFFWSILHGCDDVLKALLDGGIDVGLTCPLHTAAGTRRPTTALELAIMSWRDKEVGMLLRAGAWEKEDKEHQAELLESIAMRKSIATAFRDVGIDVDLGGRALPHIA